MNSELQAESKSFEPGSLPFETEIVLWRGRPEVAELKRLDKECLILNRELTGPGLLRAGGRFLALGEVEDNEGRPVFRITRMLTLKEAEELLHSPSFSLYTIGPAGAQL